jgi:hypothetical protein
MCQDLLEEKIRIQDRVIGLIAETIFGLIANALFQLCVFIRAIILADDMQSVRIVISCSYDVAWWICLAKMRRGYKA